MKRRTKKAKPPTLTEAQVTRQVLDAARVLGLKLERRNVGGMYRGSRYVRFGEEGDPDWEATLPGGRRLGLEIKRPGERPTRAQLAKLRAMNREGAVGLWTDDGARFLKLMPRLLAGGWAEIDDDGTPYVAWDEGRKGATA